MPRTVAWPPFDDAVVRAMARWPDVPPAYGWLALDCRGAWRLRGGTISHARSQAFLARHYRADERGWWYVQNGPQQVFVDLDYTPWVYRYHRHTGFTTHTALAANEIEAAHIDDDGNLLLLTAVGIGVVDDRDLEAVSDLIHADAGDDSPQSLRWHAATLPLLPIERSRVCTVYGFEPRPRAPA